MKSLQCRESGTRYDSDLHERWHWMVQSQPSKLQVSFCSRRSIVAAETVNGPRLAAIEEEWTSWAIALPGADWEEHDEQAVWEEIDD